MQVSIGPVKRWQALHPGRDTMRTYILHVDATSNALSTKMEVSFLITAVALDSELAGGGEQGVLDTHAALSHSRMLSESGSRSRPGGWPGL